MTEFVGVSLAVLVWCVGISAFVWFATRADWARKGAQRSFDFDAASPATPEPPSKRAG